eukprot:c26071_g1_i1.p1 GENE.c26071_g1_i1~~c26071_g1_i1.p1  ORF type:complete len:209 (+),score=45.08 c26071_g1_i1:96-629(+)
MAAVPAKKVAPPPVAKPKGLPAASEQATVRLDAASDATSPTVQIFMFAKGGGTDDVAALVAAGGIDVNAVDTVGNTCLHYAAQGGHMSTVDYLLSVGANPNALNHNGDTPLHKAAWKNHPEVCQQLLDGGCDRYLKNNDGETALDLGAENETSVVLSEVFDMMVDETVEAEAYSDSD